MGDKSEFLASFLKRKNVTVSNANETTTPVNTDKAAVSSHDDNVETSPKEVDSMQKSDTSSTNNKADEEMASVAAKRKRIENLAECPRITVHRFETHEACLHEVAVPPGREFTPFTASDRPPAKTFPFTLDPFQKEAMLCIDHNESVLVSAHTSAGKTAVAEYAIASSLRDKQRVIYTTPIKALSNQKYREFSDQFTDVGLLTGDVSVNPNASVLIMTTEILRSMLYRGSEIIREIGWVVFDEIHYMRDPHRGVVWEESIILLPHRVHQVFLSATIPNACEFAQWVSALHQQVCHVVYTDYRPVPLQHYIYPMGGSGIILVVNEKGEFVENNFRNAMSHLVPKEESGVGANRRNAGGMAMSTQRDQNNFCLALVRLIMEKELEPVIIFSFSKKECELYALKTAELDFNSPEEKRIVTEVFKQAIDMLSDEDKGLPQVDNLLPLLRRGIGIHHSGLLPILKEMVEILFSEGYIKCLFATETFAMGLNMPARTVLFTSARKYDGKGYRWITSGEYVQMSGRAGRRGKDERGLAILVVDERMSDTAARHIIQGKPDPLNSAFHLSYNMVLNLMRVEQVNPEFMMQRSFHQFQNRAVLPYLQQDLQKLKQELENIRVDHEESVSAYYNLKNHVNDLHEEMMQIIRKPKNLLPFLQAGRLVHIRRGNEDFGWGVVIAVKKRTFGADKRALPENSDEESGKGGNSHQQALTVMYVLDCLLNVPKRSAIAAAISGNESAPLPPVPTHLTMTQEETPAPPATEQEASSSNSETSKSTTTSSATEACIVAMALSCVHGVSAVRLLVPSDLRPPSARIELMSSIPKVAAKLGGRLPPLDPVKDMKIEDAELVDLVKKLNTYQERLQVHPMHKHELLPKFLEAYQKKLDKKAELEAIEKKLIQKTELIRMSELKSRKRILRRLKYCTESDVVELKGRVACEISSADELILTEMLFDGSFSRLTPSQIGALLTCLVFDEKSNSTTKVPESLVEPLRTLQNTARRIARISQECDLPGMDEHTYLEAISTAMLGVTMAWMEGSTFAAITGMTEVYEGSIVRCMRRTQEVVRELINAAKSIGNKELEEKFVQTSTLMKRGIVFASSLYI